MCKFATNRRDFFKNAGAGVAATGIAGAFGSSLVHAADVEKSSYNADVDPVATYAAKVSPKKDFYDEVIATNKGKRQLVYKDILDRHSGNAFRVNAGQVIRFEQQPSKHDGRTQIADILFVTPDLEQISDHLNTSALEGLNPRVYSGIWTQSGFLEKIVTVVADEFPYDTLEHDKVSHMFFAAHCNAEWINMVHGEKANVNSCHENFLHGFSRLPAIHAIKDKRERRRVVQRLSDRNDINVFQPNWFTQDESGVTRCRLSPGPAVPDGTGIEFYAEKDIYAVASNCPYADQALPFPEAKNNPIYVTVWETGIKPYSEDHLGMREMPWQEKVWNRILSKDTSPK